MSRLLVTFFAYIAIGLDLSIELGQNGDKEFWIILRNYEQKLSEYVKEMDNYLEMNLEKNLI